MDQQTFELIDRIANEHARVANRKKFGYLTRDDIVNEIWVICLDRMKYYDPKVGPLEHYLRVIVHHRLINEHKKMVKGINPPCITCEMWDKGQTPDCVLFGYNKEKCEKFADYQLNKNSRNALMNSSDNVDNRSNEDNTLLGMVGKELIASVIDKIPKKYKRDFEKFINREKVSRLKFKRLSKEVRKILNDESIKKFNSEELEHQKLTELTINGENIEGENDA